MDGVTDRYFGHSKPVRAGSQAGFRIPATLLALFVLIWTPLAIAPVIRSDWLLENLLVFAAVPILIVKSLSARDFSIKVLTSYRIVVPASEARGDDSTAVRDAFLEEVLRRERGELTMPAWESERSIRPHVLDLYAYLRARADGALGPGRPQREDD